MIFCFGFFKENKLHKHASATTGKVYDVVGYSKSTNVFVKYEYTVSGKTFKHQRSIIGIGDNSDNLNLLSKLLNGKEFPVVYDSTDFENSEILFTKRQYKKYRLNR